MPACYINYLWLFGSWLLIAAVSGCADSAAGSKIADVEESPAYAGVAESSRETPPNLPQDAADTSGSRDDAQSEDPQPAYEWPNPDRAEIFLPPARKPVDASANSRNKSSVDLLGFVNVDREQVLLEIDGVVAATAEGESHGDLKVLSIDPPKVTLQRDDRTWTVNLFDGQ